MSSPKKVELEGWGDATVKPGGIKLLLSSESSSSSRITRVVLVHQIS